MLFLVNVNVPNSSSVVSIVHSIVRVSSSGEGSDLSRRHVSIPGDVIGSFNVGTKFWGFNNTFNIRLTTPVIDGVSLRNESSIITRSVNWVGVSKVRRPPLMRSKLFSGAISLRSVFSCAIIFVSHCVQHFVKFISKTSIFGRIVEFCHFFIIHSSSSLHVIISFFAKPCSIYEESKVF